MPNHFFSRRITRLVINDVKEQANRPIKNIVRLPTVFAVISIICICFFSALTLWAALAKDASLWVALGFSFFVLVGIFVLVLYFNVRIYYDENNFTVKNFWGTKRTFKYEDITEAVKANSGWIVRAGGREFTVETDLQSGRDFYSYARERYKALHDGKEIPRAKAPTNDIFKGNSSDRGVSFIILYILLFPVASVTLCMGIISFVKTQSISNLILIAFGFLVFSAYVFFVVFSIIVARNPQKFSRKVINGLFQEGYIKIPRR